QVTMLGSDILAGLRLWDFAARRPEVGGNHRQALTTMALAYKDVLRRGDKRKFVIDGQAAPGEDRNLAQARGQAVAAELRALGVADDRILDVRSHPPETGRMTEEAAKHERAVVVTLTESLQLVQPDVGRPGADEDTRRRIKEHAPEPA